MKKIILLFLSLYITAFANEICYALDDTQNKLYKVTMQPGANPLPVATKITLHGVSPHLLNGEAEAYYSKDGLIYGFHKGSTYPTLYSINPSNGQVTKIKDLTFMKRNVSGAAFYAGNFYLLAEDNGENTLYKIDATNWSKISEVKLNGNTKAGDGLAINENGDVYIINDDHNKIYTLNLTTGTTTYLTQINTNEDAEALSFAKDGNIYTENSEDGVSSDTDKLFSIDLSTGAITAAAQIPHSDDIDIEGLSCNTEAGGSSNTPPPTPSPTVIRVSDASTTEGNSGTKNLVFNLSLSSPAPSGGISISYSTSNGTAKISDRDYISKSGTLIIPQGATSGTIKVQIRGDKKVESDETFNLNLSSTANIIFQKI